MGGRVVVLLVCGLSPSVGLGYRRAEVEGVAGRYLYWPARTLTYALNRDGCKDVSIADAAGAVKRAFFAWATPSCTDLYFNSGGLEATDKSNLTLGQSESPDRKNLVIWRKAWPPPGVTEPSLTREIAALTTVIYESATGAIIDADIDLNSRDFTWTVTDDSTRVLTDIQNTLAHEVGHLIGLTHSDEGEATMFPTTRQGEVTKRSLHADDLLGVCTVYPFGKPTPPGAGTGQVEPEEEGGCSVARPGRGGRARGALARAERAVHAPWAVELLGLVVLAGRLARRRR